MVVRDDCAFRCVIRKFVRLKVEIQQTPTSYRLETGLQLLIVCLITSVLVLGLVVLAEKGIVPADKVLYLGYAQLVLFVMGMASMLVAVIAEDSGLRWVEQLAGSVSRRRLLRRIHRELELAEWHVQYVVEAMDRAREHDSHDSPDTPPASSSRREEERWLRIASGTLDQIEDFLAHVRQGLESYRTVPDTPKGTQQE